MAASAGVFGFSIGDVVALTSLASSVYSAWVSTRYDEQREYRELQQQLETLQSTLKTVTTLLEEREDLSANRKDVGHICEQVSQTLLDALPLGFDGQRQNQYLLSDIVHSCRSEERVMGIETISRALAESWRQHIYGYEPLFWRLQRRFSKTADNAFSSLSSRLPTTSNPPSPLTLVVSWVVLAIVVAAYYETHPGHRYRRFFIVGSAFVALLISVGEQSSMSTMILTNMPWCVTLGILVDKLVHSVLASCGSERVRHGHLSHEETGWATEKSSMAYRETV